MKKLLTLLLTLLMAFTLVGCNSNENTPVVDEPQQEVVEPTVDEPIVGGYIDVEDGTLTDELKDIFNTALKGLMGATYEPQELVATQVVAGINYKFKANGTKTTNPITKGTYYITIYKDLQGNVELKDIEVIEEKQEEVKTNNQDITQMSFWVVFYDQYGNELQREALKYGTVPSFKGTLPEGFEKWIYKKTESDVTSFKAITTNTYFKAVCHEVHHSSSGGSNPSPTPDPEYEQVTCLTSSGGADTPFIKTGVNTDTITTSIQFVFDAELTAPSSSGKYTRVFGNVYNDGKWRGIGLQMSPSNKICLYRGMTTGDNADEFNNTYSTSIINKISYDITFPKNSGESIIYKMGTLTDTSHQSDGISGSNDIYLYTFNEMSGDIDRCQPLSLYFMKIYVDGSLVRDYIPVKTIKEIDGTKNATAPETPIPTNTLCMYDKANDKYYLNSGSDPFTDTEINPSCLAKGTLITMADGEKKPIETLKLGDDIMTFNHDTGKLTKAKIMDFWHYDEQKAGQIILHFTNNIDVNIVAAHGFFNKEENQYVVLNAANIDSYIGKHFYNANNGSWEKLVGVTYSDEKVDTYYLATDGNFNCVAEDMLTIEDGVYYVVCSTFAYDDSMKIDSQKKYANIKQYGLFTYKDFDYLTKDEFDSHKLAYLKVALGKGLITETDLELLKNIWTSEKEILANTNLDLDTSKN